LAKVFVERFNLGYDFLNPLSNMKMVDVFFYRNFGNLNFYDGKELVEAFDYF